MAKTTTTARPTPELLEIGGKAIYEFRSHPRKAPWAKAADETRAAYRARMQEICNALAAGGYAVRKNAPAQAAAE